MFTRRKRAQDTVEYEIVKTEDEWKKELPPDRYRVLRRAGTEPLIDKAIAPRHTDKTRFLAPTYIFPPKTQPELRCPLRPNSPLRWFLYVFRTV